MLILKSSAVIQGDISSKNLIIESGATFNGACNMGGVEEEETIPDNEPSDNNND